MNAKSTLPDSKPLREEELILEQADDAYYKIAAAQVGHSIFEFTVDEKGAYT